jgi:hypothetical protein
MAEEAAEAETTAFSSLIDEEAVSPVGWNLAVAAFGPVFNQFGELGIKVNPLLTVLSTNATIAPNNEVVDVAALFGTSKDSAIGSNNDEVGELEFSVGFTHGTPPSKSLVVREVTLSGVIPWRRADILPPITTLAAIAPIIPATVSNRPTSGWLKLK